MEEIRDISQPEALGSRIIGILEAAPGNERSEQRIAWELGPDGAWMGRAISRLRRAGAIERAGRSSHTWRWRLAVKKGIREIPTPSLPVEKPRAKHPCEDCARDCRTCHYSTPESGVGGMKP